MSPESSDNQTLSFLQRRFREAGIRPQTRQGQNFLIDMNLQRVLLETAALGPDDVVLEIGTGTGGLTARIARQAAAVVTVEIDRQLFQLAGEELFELGNVTMLQTDALRNKNSLNAAVLEAVSACLQAGPAATSNWWPICPINVATPVLSNLLALERPPESMTCTIQKELAERIVARPGSKDYGALAIWVQSQCRCGGGADTGPHGVLAAAQGLLCLYAHSARPVATSPNCRSGLFPRFRAGDVLSPPQVSPFPTPRPPAATGWTKLAWIAFCSSRA